MILLGPMLLLEVLKGKLNLEEVCNHFISFDYKKKYNIDVIFCRYEPGTKFDSTKFDSNRPTNWSLFRLS